MENVIVLLAFRHGFSKEMPNIALLNKMLNHLAVLVDSHGSFTVQYNKNGENSVSVDAHGSFTVQYNKNGENSVSVDAAVVFLCSTQVQRCREVREDEQAKI
jgi:hypothetical protein